MQVFLSTLIFASSITLVLSVLLQESKGSGLSSTLSGSEDTLFGKSKSKGLQAMLQRITVISGAIMMLSIFLFSSVFKPGQGLFE
ncbi:MAG: preprotein translocase subunit SecG [Eubacteriaceae bacterium]|jgi:preprotein translocase subunit SecG|nr:preprotein translocase subunit SecG [Eubacteriaceae bacterium]